MARRGAVVGFVVDAAGIATETLDEYTRYYDILGIAPGASAKKIKEAWRDMAQVWHPDRFGSNERLQLKAQETLKLVNEAYDKLREIKESGRPMAAPPPRRRPERSAGWRWEGPETHDERNPLDVLREGVHSWNLWRKKYSDVVPQLAAADLRKRDLARANLRDLDLSYVNFSGADMYKADLSGSKLTGSKLRSADLNQAFLIETKFSKADLTGAILAAADLSGALLADCILLQADLTATVLKGADLRSCVGLTPQQLEAVIFDHTTRFPPGLL